MEFEHERLDIYKAAKQFALAMDGIAEGIRNWRTHPADRFFEQAASILFNIAEGAVLSQLIYPFERTFFSGTTTTMPVLKTFLRIKRDRSAFSLS
jgi:hypothetical protein